MIKRATSLSKNIVHFCRFLRQHNFSVSVEEEVGSLAAMEIIDYSNKQDFQLALKAVLCKSRKELKEFDDLFNQYWKELEKATNSKVKTKTEPVSKPATKDASFKALKTWLNGNRNEEIEQTASYSFAESISRKDFTTFPEEDLEELIKSIRALSKRLAANLNRRYEKSGKKNLLDLRRTLRNNMKRGGELLEIAFRQPKRNRIKLVVLCDVSKSMELYSAFLLQFMFAFQQVFTRIETFAFSTHLQHISPLLKQHDFTTALDVLSTQNNNWSGGTRIGASLNAFVSEFAKRLLDKRTIVVILSDGWDMGATDLLEESMKSIHGTSKKVIWLNPLAGHTSYRPDVAGMKAAMPYIDVFAPVHNVASLRRLSKWL